VAQVKQYIRFRDKHKQAKSEISAKEPTLSALPFQFGLNAELLEFVASELGLARNGKWCERLGRKPLCWKEQGG
jgi:hypothetical protein